MRRPVMEGNNRVVEFEEVPRIPIALVPDLGWEAGRAESLIASRGLQGTFDLTDLAVDLLVWTGRGKGCVDGLIN